MKHSKFLTKRLAPPLLAIAVWAGPVLAQETNVATLQVPMSVEAMDRIILEKMATGEPFDWRDVDDYMNWSALVQGDQTLAIGYQPSDYEEDLKETIHLIDVQSNRWQQALNDLVDLMSRSLDIPIETLRSDESFLLHQDEHLPYIVIKLSDFKTYQAIRQSSLVRYAMPMGYTGNVYSSVFDELWRTLLNPGCGTDDRGEFAVPPKENIRPTPLAKAKSAKVSWNYDYHSIVEAWDYSSGKDITVGVIDTGIDVRQELLRQPFFRRGYSGNRTISSGVTIPPRQRGDTVSPNDLCGHGTAMTGLIAAPMLGAQNVGIAYKANISSFRASRDVIVSDFQEKVGVANAYRFLANDNDVDIITMSLGDIFSDGPIEDAIRTARNMGKLIFNAAGTSLDWTAPFGFVVFPASIPETIAVTGVKADTLPKLERCLACHRGWQVDFAVVMEKKDPAGGKPFHQLTTARPNRLMQNTGGSSSATAAMAGMAALVWSKNPRLTRDQVLEILRNNASHGNRRGLEYGWGRVNALNAVRSVSGIGVYRPSSSQWFFDFDRDGKTDHRINNWGIAGDLPVSGNFAGNGRTGIAVYRPSNNGQWFFDFDLDGVTDKRIDNWGRASDLPLAGDFEDSGKAGIALYRPSDRTWYFDYDLDGKTNHRIPQWGIAGDLPVAGDFNRDGRTDIGLYRPSTSTWYFDLNLDGKTDRKIAKMGLPGDLPLASDFTGDGFAGVGFFRPSTKEWEFDINLDGTTEWFLPNWGVSGDLPISL